MFSGNWPKLFQESRALLQLLAEELAPLRASFLLQTKVSKGGLAEHNAPFATLLIQHNVAK